MAGDWGLLHIYSTSIVQELPCTLLSPFYLLKLPLVSNGGFKVRTSSPDALTNSLIPKFINKMMCGAVWFLSPASTLLQGTTLECIINDRLIQCPALPVPFSELNSYLLDLLFRRMRTQEINQERKYMPTWCHSFSDKVFLKEESWLKMQGPCHVDISSFPALKCLPASVTASDWQLAY